MKILRVSQSTDTEAWLYLRLGKITGSKAKKVKPLSRGADRTPQGFWQLVAEKVSIKPDGEDDMSRGHRLEKETLAKLSAKYGLDIDDDPGMWISDEDEDIAVSPDGAEKSDTPTWAVESKNLASANHLKFVVRDRLARKSKDYKAIDSIPNEAKAAYRDQAIQYFVVNEHLERLYFCLHDDRIAIDNCVFHDIIIERKDILDLIAAQKEQEKTVLKEVNMLIAELMKA